MATLLPGVRGTGRCTTKMTSCHADNSQSKSLSETFLPRTNHWTLAQAIYAHQSGTGFRSDFATSHRD